MREEIEDRLRTRLQALRDEFETLKREAGQAEVNLELEFYTLLETLQIDLESVERKFEGLLESGEKRWDDLETEVEQVWNAARELIRAINSP